jgi:acyl carrier protein
MPVQQAEVFEKVRTCLVDALGVDDDEVTPEASITGDLGAESIDYLDILFSLEKTIGIKIPRGELFPEDVLSNAQYVEDGKLTSEGLEQLKKRMPFADLSKFEADPRLANFVNLLTVQDLVNYVTTKLA